MKQLKFAISSAAFIVSFFLCTPAVMLFQLGKIRLMVAISALLLLVVCMAVAAYLADDAAREINRAKHAERIARERARAEMLRFIASER